MEKRAGQASGRGKGSCVTGAERGKVQGRTHLPDSSPSLGGSRCPRPAAWSLVFANRQNPNAGGLGPSWSVSGQLDSVGAPRRAHF